MRVCVCVCGCVQWLRSVIHLHADINKFLSSTADSDVVSLPSSAKPVASVMPQLQPNCVPMTAEPAAALEIPAAMETETDEAETTLSVDTSEVNVSLETLSKGSRDSSMSDVEHRSCSAVVEMTAACCESNGCRNVDDLVRRYDLSSPDNCCHSDSDVTARTENSRCSEYEAASVLTDMQQFAAAAAIPALSTSFSAISTGLNTTSDTRSASVKTVDCGPALLPPLSSGISNTSGHSTSGQCEHYCTVIVDMTVLSVWT